MTLLFFYKRLFLVSHSSPLSIFWWANFVYVVLWFFGSTSFYLFQCKPVQWYFIRYFQRYQHLPIPGDMKGECNVTTVLNVALPLIFSLLSDFSLLLLPIWAISRLRLNKSKKRGLMAVFGIGLVACVLELARVLVLVIHTDDQDDTSCEFILQHLLNTRVDVAGVLKEAPTYALIWIDGVAVFLILTAAEETTAIVCACLPVIVPQIVRQYRRRKASHSYVHDSSVVQGSSGKRSSRGFMRVASLNHMWTVPTSINASKIDGTHDDDIPLTRVEITGNHSASKGSDRERHDRTGENDNTTPSSTPHAQATDNNSCAEAPAPIAPGDIHVRTDIRIDVGTAV
ncbi:hypothetical protein SLS62_003996 [Diatrype stigma]|uniref:Rhodopsin domain-containing protein n=1 Tax=Diatrype stigma TaxID=117547 RepID=A0AAN9V3P0_9PEZI